MGKRIVLSMSVMVFICLVFESVARLYEVTSGEYGSQKAFRLSCPLPYRETAYYSRKFVKESFRQPLGWKYPEGTRLVMPNDYEGVFFHVRKGVRVTAFQPPDGVFSNKVYLFGGSAIYGSEVPDEMTVASWLQKMLVENVGTRFRVENLGVTSVGTSEQYARLQVCPLKPGDIVIFYDGVNDILQDIYYADPSETMMEKFRREYAAMSCLARVRLWIFGYGSPYSALIRLLMNPQYSGALPSHLRDMGKLDSLSDHLRIKYTAALTGAQEYAAAKSARFVHFLQPNIFSTADLSVYERNLIANHYINPEGLEVAFRVGMPVLKSALELISGKVISYDLSGVLVEHQPGREFYLDFCHVNHEANRMIARRMYECIFNFPDRDLKADKR